MVACELGDRGREAVALGGLLLLLAVERRDLGALLGILVEEKLARGGDQRRAARRPAERRRRAGRRPAPQHALSRATSSRAAMRSLA